MKLISVEHALRGAMVLGDDEGAEDAEQAIEEAVLQVTAVEILMNERAWWEMMLRREGAGGTWMLWA